MDDAPDMKRAAAQRRWPRRLEALRANRARASAGGTDIVPNLKDGMYDTQHLVALTRAASECEYLREVRETSAAGRPLPASTRLAHSEVV